MDMNNYFTFFLFNRFEKQLYTNPVFQVSVASKCVSLARNILDPQYGPSFILPFWHLKFWGDPLDILQNLCISDITSNCVANKKCDRMSTETVHFYQGADKSLARSGRKQVTVAKL